MNHKSSKEATFFLRLILTKNPSKTSFSINFNLIWYKGTYSLTHNNKPPPLHTLLSL